MKYLEAYKDYIIRVCTLLGVPVEVAIRHVEEMIYFETRLAEVNKLF